MMSGSGTWYFIQWAHFLALSLWIGGITSLAGIAAPAAHASMASRAVAGEIVGKILKKLNTVELLACTVLLATSLASFRFVRARENWLGGMMMILIVMGLLTLYYGFHLSPRLESIKERMPTLDSLSSNHAAKIEFDRLHRIYVKLMSLNLVLALGVLYLSVVIFK